MHNGEQSGNGPNTQRHDEDCGNRKARGSAQSPPTVSQTSGELLDAHPAPRIPGFIPDHSRVTKNASSRIAGFLWGHTTSDVLGNLLFEVKLNLIVEFARGAVALEQHSQAQTEFLSRTHGVDLLSWVDGLMAVRLAIV
jgi:hypothetical protein